MLGLSAVRAPYCEPLKWVPLFWPIRGTLIMACSVLVAQVVSYVMQYPVYVGIGCRVIHPDSGHSVVGILRAVCA